MRKIQLFGYETEGGRQSRRWRDPISFPGPHRKEVTEEVAKLETSYSQWSGTKRDFTHDELEKGSWIKLGDDNTFREVHLHLDGTLTENELFNPTNKWQGSWKMLSGVLRMIIGIYEADFIASREGIVHSGVGFAGEGSMVDSPYAYYKLIHLP
jgi:hypothetical protein